MVIIRTKKILSILLLIVFGFTMYEYADFKKSKPLNEWCEVQPIAGNTIGFIKFSLFNQHLDPHVTFVTDHNNVVSALQSLHVPPTYSLGLPLKIAFSYANVIIVQIPQQVADDIKHANKVKVIFSSNEEPILCQAPDWMLRDWQLKLQ